jgi:Holliday junction resolvasome RuvABC endonuclease subunit
MRGPEERRVKGFSRVVPKRCKSVPSLFLIISIRGGKMNVLAVDQSLVESGVTVKDGRLCDYVSSTIKPKMRGVERLQFIRDALADLIEKHEIQEVIMEGYSFASQGRSVFDLGELGGVLKVMFYDLGLPLHIIDPSTLKKFVVGKGNAKKEEMLLKIYKRWGLEFKNHNVADSFALMKYYEANVEGIF